MRDDAISRRGVLAAAGTALFAGCSELNLPDEDSRETIPSPRLPDVSDGGEPIVVETVPVDIERTILVESSRHVDELLGTIPLPFGPEDVPNGHVRERLLDAAAEATASVGDARTARSRLSALRSLHRARAEARYAAAGWAFAEGETTRAELKSEHRAAVGDARALRAEHEYVGTDPVEAALLHARVERNLENVLTDRGPSTLGGTDRDALLTVAEWGEHAESAHAFVADSRYLYRRFRSSLPADADSLEGTLTTAVDSLTDRLRNRRGELPAQPTEDDPGMVWRLRYRLWDAADSSVDRITGAVGPASAVLAATEGLTDLLAFDRVQGRIDDGERFEIETADDVEAARSQARDAIRTALEESPRPDLARPVLADAASSVAFADGTLSRMSGDVTRARLDDPVRRYVTATARARSVPAASREVLDALGSE